MVGRRSSILGRLRPSTCRRTRHPPLILLSLRDHDNNRKAAAGRAFELTLPSARLNGAAGPSPRTAPAVPFPMVAPSSCRFLFGAPLCRAASLRTSLLGAARVATADEPDAGGTFTTPGPSPRAATCVRCQPPGAATKRDRRQRAGPPRHGATPDQGGNGNPRTGARGAANDSRAAPSRPPPPKPSEFQRFVEGATGRLLPIFGARFFADAADTFRRSTTCRSRPTTPIGPGDEIVIRAWGSIDIDYRSTVDRNGQLNLPKVGSFKVAGVKAADLEKQPARADRPALHQLQPQRLRSASCAACRSSSSARRSGPACSRCRASRRCCRPSSPPAGRGRTARCARSSCAATASVISELDVYEFLVQGDKSKDLQLAAGDVVVFQPAGPRVALTGAIDTPAIYELKSAQEPLARVAALRRRRAGAGQSEPRRSSSASTRRSRSPRASSRSSRSTPRGCRSRCATATC